VKQTKGVRRFPSHVPLDLDDFLCFSIYSANHAFNRLYQPLLRKINLTYPQFIVMILLWKQNNQTVGEIAEKLHLQTNTLTPLLKRLEALGYVARARNPEDERQVRVKLTEASHALRLRTSEIVAKVRDSTGIPGDEMTELVEKTRALREALENQMLK
jgi:MarR family transcriptional regulator, organic hydroperoxide resistance regulator